MIILIVLILFAFQVLTIPNPNLFIGTGSFGFGCGSNSPAAQLPYGMMRLGPDTTPRQQKFYAAFQHFGGYSYADHYVQAFSHMHLVGAGVLDLGILGILPVEQKNVSIPNYRQIKVNKYSEKAQPGYYTIKTDNNIKVELTATLRAGIHRYSFENPGNYTIYMQASYFLQKKNPHAGYFEFLQNQNAFQGISYSQGSFSGRFGGLKIYFYVKWFGNVVSRGGWNDTYIGENLLRSNGTNTGGYLRVNNDHIDLYVGISYVSIANAKQNLEKQIGNNSFDNVLRSNKAIWFQELSRFQIIAVNKVQQEKIDTAIYRTLLAPTTFNDYNGDYLSFALDGSISKVPSYMKAVYTDMSLWDVHRTEFPWILFQDPQRFHDIAESIVLFNRVGGYMPKWPFANGHTGCMIGAHGTTVLADWIIKEAHKYKQQSQLNTILGYMLRNANTITNFDQRTNPQLYLKYEFLGYEFDGRSAASQTVQYAYNDYGIAQTAKLLGNQQIYSEFMRRSKFYKNTFNNQTKFFECRYINGSFVKLKQLGHLNIFSNYYVEGNAWHYRFYAPHDGEGLIELFGGKAYFVNQLQKFFKRSIYWPNTVLPNPYYWAGNQHDLFSVWMFSYANRSDLVQKYSRFILKNFYTNDQKGVPGNDDYSTMSAWLVFAQLGFYPLPSTNRYILGSPMVHSARITRKFRNGQKKIFTVHAYGNSINKDYVKQIKLDGIQINELDHQKIANGSSLQFFML